MINECNENNIKRIVETIKSVQNSEKIDDEIVKNSFIYENNDEIAMISYEKFGKYGLIRYFIFKRSIKEGIIYELVDKLINGARKNGITDLIAISSKEMIDLFTSLGFLEINKERLYIEETCFTKTRFKDASVLLKNIATIDLIAKKE